MIKLTFDTLPEALRDDAQRLWETFLDKAAAEHTALLAQHPAVVASIPKVWACSPFVAKSCGQSPALLAELISSGDLQTAYEADGYRLRCAAAQDGISDEAAMQRALRLWRRREMVRIAWRDLAGWAPLAESFRDLSNLAYAAIQFATDFAYSQVSERFGTPCDSEGKPQPLVTLAMGKLGGRELNFSSDIDLIFVYPDSGETQGGRRALDNQEFFVRLGQKIIQHLDNITVDGFVFRTDMRLRPFGDSGPLAMNFAALEEYYLGHAREWERYALIKARAATGGEAGEALMATLLPFVYRRYLDYGAFESLRDLKAQIDQEVRRKGHDDNIKLGQGGIREVEFICQAFQLLRGGRLRDLQSRHLLDALAQIKRHGLLPDRVADSLGEAYCFLRLAEQRLQAIDDRQTQRLPDNPLDQARLAYAMDFADWPAFLKALHQHQQQVHLHYREVIVGPEESQPHSVFADLAALWDEHLHLDEQSEQVLRESGYANPTAALASLRAFNDAYRIRQLSRRGRQRLDALLPQLLTTIRNYSKPDLALERTLKLVETVAQRSVYLALLLEHPVALTHLVQLCGDSSWIAEQLTRYPLLLDELLDPRRLYDPLKPEELDNALHAQLAHLPLDDLEAQMDTLRQFKRAQVLHVAAAELTGNLNVETASDYLTAIADCLLRQALNSAWTDLTHKHGVPLCPDEGGSRPAHFAILGYGKAGGIEMSYSSDVDVVFLHDSRGGSTDGDKPLDNNVFFARLAKRIMHLITTPTSAGVLYEVDARLRPGGNSGLMVSSLDAFEQYQHEEAWTWEHQALVRARAVAGHTACTERFETIRCEVLRRERADIPKLKQDVREMRTKMRQHLDKTNAKQFDLKQGTGGIADIEFVVQYGVLQWAKDYPSLLDTTGMLPLLARFRDNALFSAEITEALSAAYRAYRTETHRRALQNLSAVVDDGEFRDHRQAVSGIWQALLGEEHSRA